MCDAPAVPDRPGVFCIEMEWERDLESKVSVRPMFDLLESQEVVSSYYRDALTRAEVRHLVERWGDAPIFKHHPYLYLAAHGEPGRLKFGPRDADPSISLRSLVKLAGTKRESDCRVIHVGSCSVMKSD